MSHTLLVENLQAALVVVSLLSIISSLSVVLSFLLFPTMRKRVFMHIIFYLSLSDLFVSIASSWGYPGQGTTLCTLQSFCLSIFVKGEALWNFVLCYQLHAVVMTGNEFISLV